MKFYSPFIKRGDYAKESHGRVASFFLKFLNKNMIIETSWDKKGK